jgi:hypothetical protein
MTAPVRNDDPYKSLGFWRWLIAGLLLLAWLLCMFSGMGKMAATATAPAMMTEGAGFANFLTPNDNEVLDAQSYVLEGTGTPGDTLEVWQSTPENPAGQYDTVTVAQNGQWSSVVTGAKPGTAPGTYTYEIRKPGSSDALVKRTVVVKAGQTQASNAKCPCKLRIFTLRKQNIADSTITLLKDGKAVDTGSVDKLFADLTEGDYTYTVSAPGFEDYTAGTAKLPRNKNFEVYLKPVRK